MSCWWKILGIVSIAVSAACSSSSGGPSSSANGSCTSTGGGAMTCIDFGAGFTSSEAMQACSGTSMTFSSGSCPSTNRVGRCEISETKNGVTAADSVSFYLPDTAAAAMSGCAMENGVNGVTTTWVPN